MPTKMKKNKERLDTILLNKGYVPDISYARALILAKKVKVDGSFVTQAGSRFNEDIHIELKPEKKYVSRGGIKLHHALTESKLNIKDKRCLDIGKPNILPHNMTGFNSSLRAPMTFSII